MSSRLRNIVVLCLITILFLGCSSEKKEELNIGFVAGLSGKYSSLGISIRNGFTLAFDEIDYVINNKKITIIEKDDKQNTDDAKEAIEYFVKNDIKLIVGNATSAMTKISHSLLENSKDTLLISATASSSEFTQKKDNFLRIQVDKSSRSNEKLVDYIVNKKFKDTYFIYDSNNKSYVQDYQIILQDLIVKRGGKVFFKNIDINQPYEVIQKEIQAKKDDLIIIVANSVDSASMIQFLRLQQIKSQVICSGWAKTYDFLENGGRAIEGVLFFTGYDDNSEDLSFMKFKKYYQLKYNKKPSVFAAQGYELGKLLIQELEKNKNISTLKQQILQEKVFDGLQGRIIFNEYGDVTRDYFFMEVKNGKFVKSKLYED